MFDCSSSLLNSSASAACSASASAPVPVPASDPIAENALFHTLFATTMPAVNTIQDFCLFPNEQSFDFPLFNSANPAAKNLKSAAQMSAVNNASLNFFNNPLCTPQTPSLDLVAASAPVEGLGFDSCIFFDDGASASHPLMDTPFTPFLDAMDTPLLVDTPLETPFPADFGVDAQLDVNNISAFPLFDDWNLDIFAVPATIEPQQVTFKSDDVVPSPASTLLSSPTESLEFDFSDDDEFVPSRSAALVSGLKRKADSLFAEDAKKPRAMDLALKKAAPKRFSCIHPGCDKSFARLFNLHTHEKTHDPEKARPFLCSDAVCNKSFSRKHDLQRHEASVHKGERNFVCETCSKSFARQDGLRRHLAVKGPCFNNQWSAT